MFVDKQLPRHCSQNHNRHFTMSELTAESFSTIAIQLYMVLRELWMQRLVVHPKRRTLNTFVGILAIRTYMYLYESVTVPVLVVSRQLYNVYPRLLLLRLTLFLYIDILKYMYQTDRALVQALQLGYTTVCTYYLLIGAGVPFKDLQI